MDGKEEGPRDNYGDKTMPKFTTPVDKTRIQIDLSEREVERMNRVMEQCDIESRKDLFNNALTIMEWAIKEVGKGFSIASVEDPQNNTKCNTFTTPALNNASQSKR
jgi:hypothetical protein